MPEYDPGIHELQTVDPGEIEYCPTGHWLQGAVPEAEKYPALHAHALAPAAELELDGQAVHDPAPLPE